MNAAMMITSAVACFAGAAVLALIFSFHKTLSGAIAGLCGAVASLMTLAAGGVVLLGGQSAETVMPLIRHTVEITPLNAIWLVTFGLCGLFISLFNIDWHRHPHAKANGLLVNLLMATAVCTVIASNLGALVVMAEIMALCGVFLTGCSASGKLWFALGRLGTLLLALACWLVWQRFGTLDFAALNGHPLGNDVWLLGAIGFGLLAGIIPLHGWVPQAHANASAPAAALFSVVVMKVGLFGILAITLTGGQPPLWWGIVLLIAGMITAFVGGLYALMEHNIQRLLAYHTLENIGIILLGIGAGVTGLALNHPALIAAGFIGGLYHLVNHSLFKSTLFLGAGSVWFRTGHRDIEKLGGIGKKMPVISLAMLVGLMAMAALPPLNGFAGEWVIYQSFFALGQSDAFIARLLGPLLAVGLAITGALAVMCMAKVYGVTFLGAPRTREAENACCAPLLMGVSVGRAGAVLHRGRRRRAVAAAAAGQRHSAAADRGEYHRLPAHDCAAADRRTAAAARSDAVLQTRPARLPLARCGVGLRLRTRTVDGHHRPRFRHAGEGELRRRAEATLLAEPGGLGTRLAECRRARAVPPSGGHRAGGAGGHCDFTRSLT
ncbi:formate hydrogenlyase subunit 3 [Enterobacter asburiae]|uniref:Formate hydrogenlyase subunit 3 n=1 Tax=Enterobacter asburiae TaxID=61645 RepID=A0A376FCU7_ENTAS|nr:formate hydrogenlyase subunit 3 [Enterobacter asburiae]